MLKDGIGKDLKAKECFIFKHAFMSYVSKSYGFCFVDTLDGANIQTKFEFCEFCAKICKKALS